MVYETLKELFTAICDSVREKEGSVGLIDHQDIPDRILEIKGIDTSGATAEEMDIVKGKSAFVDGVEVNGGLPRYGDPWMIPNSSINLASKGSQIVANTKTTEDFYSRAGMNINFEINKSRFGNARPEDVTYGVIFTSEEGFAIPGTREDVSADNWEEADAISDFHYWEKVAEGNKLIEELVNDYQLSYSNASLNIAHFGFTHYASEITTVDGALALVDPIARGTIDKETLAGKYIQNGSDFYRIPDDVIITTTAGSGATAYSKKDANRVFKLTSIASGKISYVVSSDPDAFPQNGMKDGYSYVYKGTLNETGTKAVIAALTVTENGIYTVPAGVDGYSPITVNVSSEDIPAVSQAVPVIEVSNSGLITATATQDGGQVSAGTQSATKQLTTQPAKTYTPGASDQVIPSGKYLIGALTIKGDSNLKSGNIKKGVSIFGVTGSLEAGTGDGNIEAASLSDVYYWTKSETVDEVQEKEVTSIVLSYYSSTSAWDSVKYADEIEIVDGVVSLVNPVTITLNSGRKNEIKGKHIYASYTGKYYRIPSDAEVTYHQSTLNSQIKVDIAYELTVVAGTGESSGVAISANRSAYPDNGAQDGCMYVYQGTLSG